MAYDPTPICLRCHKEMRCEKNAVLILLKSKNEEPLRIDCADLYACQWGCGQQILKGFAPEGIEHWEQFFPETMRRWENQQPEYQFWFS